MVPTPTDRPKRPNKRPKPVDTSLRRLPSGTIVYLTLTAGDTIQAEVDPQIVVHVGGRGQMSWAGGTSVPDDPRRAWGVIFLPPRAELQAHGRFSAIRVTLPGLTVAKPVGSVAEVLVGLLCRRAWSGSEVIADVALRLVRLLIADEAGRLKLKDEAQDR